MCCLLDKSGQVWSVESRLMLSAWPPRLRGTKSVAMDFRPLLDYEIVFAKGLRLDILVDDLVVCENGRAGPSVLGAH